MLPHFCAFITEHNWKCARSSHYGTSPISPLRCHTSARANACTQVVGARLPTPPYHFVRVNPGTPRRCAASRPHPWHGRHVTYPRPPSPTPPMRSLAHAKPSRQPRQAHTTLCTTPSSAHRPVIRAHKHAHARRTSCLCAHPCSPARTRVSCKWTRSTFKWGLIQISFTPSPSAHEMARNPHRTVLWSARPD